MSWYFSNDHNFMLVDGIRIGPRSEWNIPSYKQTTGSSCMRSLRVCHWVNDPGHILYEGGFFSLLFSPDSRHCFIWGVCSQGLTKKLLCMVCTDTPSADYNDAAPWTWVLYFNSMNVLGLSFAWSWSRLWLLSVWMRLEITACLEMLGQAFWLKDPLTTGQLRIPRRHKDKHSPK